MDEKEYDAIKGSFENKPKIKNYLILLGVLVLLAVILYALGFYGIDENADIIHRSMIDGEIPPPLPMEEASQVSSAPGFNFPQVPGLP